MLVVGAPDGERVRAFRRSAQQYGVRVDVIAYREVIGQPAALLSRLVAGGLVRLESPSDDPAADELLIDLGGGNTTGLREGTLPDTRAWHAGLTTTLTGIEDQLAGRPDCRFMNPPRAVLAMGDKRATDRRLAAAGVPVPDSLPPVTTASDIVDGARAAGWHAVLAKPRYGSSGAGLVAVRWRGTEVVAYTTVRRSAGRWSNSRQVVRLASWPAVIELLDALCPLDLHVQRWIPKATWGGGPVDLRVVVIAGRSRHVLARVGSGPFTNLHLGARRGDVPALRREVGEDAWAAIMSTCRRAAGAFPGALYAGVDVLVAPGWRRHWVAEVNAFGDFHEGIHSDGMDTYTAELVAASRGAPDLRPTGMPR